MSRDANYNLVERSINCCSLNVKMYGILTGKNIFELGNLGEHVPVFVYEKTNRKVVFLGSCLLYTSRCV